MTLSKVFELSGLSVSRYRRSLWLYPLFQIPLMCLGACLVAAALFWLLGLRKPEVAAAIALDLSASTYQPQPFNAPGTVMSQEVEAVRAYVQQNNQLLRNPNQVHIFGFGGVVRSLSDAFTKDSNKLETELNQSFGVLRMEENHNLKENLVRYTRQTAIDSENVDIASNWEEAVQILEIPACLPDKEAIQRQVTAKLQAAQTDAQKLTLYNRLINYLKNREAELEKEGGKDSSSYKREYQKHITLTHLNVLRSKATLENIDYTS